MQKHHAIRSLALMPFILTACENISSEDIPTSDITANVTVTHSMSSTKADVSTSLKEGIKYIDLEGQDILKAYSSVDNTPVYLRKEQNLFSSIVNILTYSTTVTGGNTGGDTFTVIFDRGSNQASAPMSTVTMTEPFATRSTTPSNSFNRNTQALTIDWATSGLSDPLTISTSGSCIKEITDRSIPDTGSYIFPSAELVASYIPATNDQNFQGEGVTVTLDASCEVTFTLKRITTGTIDGNFQGGTITGYQTTSITVNSSYTP